jgi:hypothetical protein
MARCFRLLENHFALLPCHYIVQYQTGKVLFLGELGKNKVEKQLQNQKLQVNEDKIY